MTEPMTLLLAVDESPWSVRAMDTAKILSAELKAFLYVLHVQSPDKLEESLDWLEDMKKRYMDDQTQFQVTQGDPVTEIMANANQLENLFFIIMATHGQGCSLFKWMGHVPVDVLQKSSYPVVLTRRNMNIPQRLGNILVPLDGRPPSAKVVTYVEQMASQARSDIHFLHVVGARARNKEAPGSMSTPKYMDHPGHEWGAWEHEFLERFCDIRRFMQAGIPVHFSLGHGNVEAAILRYAREHNIDLIAMTWKGVFEEMRAQILREILSASLCPVMVLPIGNIPDDPQEGETQEREIKEEETQPG